LNALLRPENVARILGVSKQTVYNLAKAGALRAVIFKTRGDRWTYRFRQEDCEGFIESSLRDGKAAG
jgi:excisionase family DNA binding protein